MWVKSSYSTWNSNCVEAAGDGGALVRDSKDKTGPVLRFPANAWTAFTTTLKEKHDA